MDYSEQTLQMLQDYEEKEKVRRNRLKGTTEKLAKFQMETVTDAAQAIHENRLAKKPDIHQMIKIVNDENEEGEDVDDSGGRVG